MANDTRPSLTKTIEERYATQKEGGAFDVKTILRNPGAEPKSGTTIDATSLQGSNFQSPNGFVVGANNGLTQVKDAQGTVSKQLSRYMQGFDNRKYKR